MEEGRVAGDVAQGLGAGRGADASSAAALIMQRWQSGDTVLIKGSRGPDDEEGVRRYGARMAEVAVRLEVAGGRS
jgi:hypothetical protein